MRLMRCRFQTGLVAIPLGISLIMDPSLGWAVVGQAEKFDEVAEANLQEFQDNLIGEEREDQLQRAEAMEKIRELQNLTDGDYEEALDYVGEGLSGVEKELLSLPERDRFRIEMGGEHRYDSNIQRRLIRQEKGDSVFEVNGATLFDLSGRKTDLRFELRSGKQWNLEFSNGDFWVAEERLRYRRKYFKKITQSSQSRISRTSSKTVEIDDKRIRWDFVNDLAFNYQITRRLSLNLDGRSTKRVFTTEAFDQDSAWEFTTTPNIFWNITPKSRFSLGYTWGGNRIRTKSSDTNSHNIRMGYFGKITPKSSASMDFSFAHQEKRAAEAPEVDTITVGVGYIWQMRPKTQMTFQAIRSLQNSTSEVSTVTADGAQTTKSDNHFTNDSVTLSFNHRITSRLQSLLTMNMSHTRSKLDNGEDEELEGRQWLFPVTLSFNYFLRRWIRLRSSYTFSIRTGNEKQDSYRAHTWVNGVQLVF